MIALTGNSLNARHRELNNKVNEAATQGAKFEDVKIQTEKSDVDRLYKIKLADKYRNVEYIIDTLKCGDNLYITKALKCAWLCDEEFSNIINPHYLHTNVFPEMSIKTRRKLLTMISMHVTNYRAESFYTYCMEADLAIIAVKFLIYTTEAFKVDVIGGFRRHISDKYMIALVGNSFTLAETVLEAISYPYTTKFKYLKSLSYLYSLSNVEYLDLVEKNILKHELIWHGRVRLGLRLSKHIMQNHKDRILRHPVLYINMLNISVLHKYSSLDDVKYYAPHLLPGKCSDFWNGYFYTEYKYLLDIIPFPERLKFIKSIFIERYAGEEFERNVNFNKSDVYELTTEEERKSWKEKYEENNKPPFDIEHFDLDQDYHWYRFVPFEKAFVAIKKYILVATTVDRRNDIVCVLVHSAKSNRELETLFNYYHHRHVNESKYYKDKFINEVLNNHEYYNFDDDCWKAFDKILHSMYVYDNLNASSCKMEYKIIAIVYAILHKKELHIALQQNIYDIDLYVLKQQTNKLPKDQEEIVYLYFINLHLKKIREFDIDKNHDEVQCAIRKYISGILDIMQQYDKPRENIPDMVIKYISLDFEFYSNHIMIRSEVDTSVDHSNEIDDIPFNQNILVRDLKNDASLVVSKIPLIRTALKDKQFVLNKLLRKIRVYFSADILAAQYMELFKELLRTEGANKHAIRAAVYGIFQIGDNVDIIDFVTKYSPEKSKISHDEIKRSLFHIRKWICNFVSLSRPHVPLCHLQKYIAGDYFKFFLPSMLTYYAANMKPDSFILFIKFLLESPTSIHGLRLAFQHYPTQDLILTITDIWDSTTNVSLRQAMYQGIYDRMYAKWDTNVQYQLFDVFKKFTLYTRDDDADEYFNLLLTDMLPYYHLLGEHVFHAWQVLNTLPHEKVCKYKCKLIDNMANDIEHMKQDLIESIIFEYITAGFNQELIKNDNAYNEENFIQAKWNLTIKYLVHFPDQNAFEQKLNIVQIITKEYIRQWDNIDSNGYTFRTRLIEFIDSIRSNLSPRLQKSFLCGIRMYEQILKELRDALPLVEVYEIVWSLRLNIITANILATVTDIINSERRYENYLDRFPEKFAVLLNEFIEQGMYYSSARNVILESLQNVIALQMSELPNCVYSRKHTLDDMLVLICSKLVEIDKFDTYYFALEILPKSLDNIYSSYKQLYNSVINKINSYKDVDIKHFLYRKFVRGNGYRVLICNADSNELVS